MSRILLITLHFPPCAASGSFRLLGFAEHLPTLGWEMSVVSCGNYPYEPIDTTLSDRVPLSVTVHEIDYPQFAGWRLLLSRLCRRAGIWYEGSVWVSKVWPVITNLVSEKKPDVILTSGPPHLAHMLGRRAKRFSGAAWVADFRDPWVAGEWRGKVLTQRERRAERSVVAEADLVIANAPRAKEAFCEQYPHWSHKFITITNGYDAAPSHASKPCGNGPIRMLHSGEIYAGRDPRPLLDAISRFEPEFHRIEIDFIGRVEGTNLELEIHRRGLGNRVHALGHVPCAEAKRAIEDANIQLLIDAPGRRVGVPAKLYEYIGAGRPILALAERDSDTAWALEESGIPHALAPPRDVNAIAAAVSDVIGLASAPITELPAQAARFTRANLAAELSEHFSQLLHTLRHVACNSTSHTAKWTGNSELLVAK